MTDGQLLWTLLSAGMVATVTWVGTLIWEPEGRRPIGTVAGWAIIFFTCAAVWVFAVADLSTVF